MWLWTSMFTGKGVMTPTQQVTQPAHSAAQGWDKTYCLQYVEGFEEIHFFGDKTFPVRPFARC